MESPNTVLTFADDIPTPSNLMQLHSSTDMFYEARETQIGV